jgi:hypothetical protein
MTLSIKYQKVFGVPVAPDAISQGSTSLASYPAITGDYVQNINLNMKTYTFDLRGINEAKAAEIVAVCDANAESLAKGEIDMTNPSGEGIFTYRDAKCVPIGYQDGGTLDIGGTTRNYTSFQVTCLTDKVVASV